MSATLHLLLHDVWEAFGLYLQQPFLKQVRREDGANSSVNPVPGGTKAGFPLDQTET
ncbi:hypothetical protein [Edaphobacter aggregans]|uniref:hypothetical protein n=1 Tax=Edaphobacter aggregans TaxID=570835 RepID=UPI001639F16D|nr:hypothetical protein [Edaphobacter aggregans]